ncbi:hypothetical protein AB0P37_08510 [Streptomyces antimycoticus]|uniref:hypothetical protein n=1 Tax=Streptomyces antimycoticus TaxID=68175 RepID=UPI00342B2B79
MNEERYHLPYSEQPRMVVAWLAARGHRAMAFVPAPGTLPGIVFAKGPNGTAKLALVGDTLVYDGKTVKIETA